MARENIGRLAIVNNRAPEWFLEGAIVEVVAADNFGCYVVQYADDPADWMLPWCQKFAYLRPSELEWLD